MCFLLRWLCAAASVRQNGALRLSVEHKCQLELWNADLGWHRRRAPAVTAVAPQMSVFLSLFSFPVVSFLSSSICCSDSLRLCQRLPSLSVLCHCFSFSSSSLSCTHTHTHTHTHTLTLLKLSCGNRACPCKSWLLSYKSGQSGIQHLCTVIQPLHAVKGSSESQDRCMDMSV